MELMELYNQIQNPLDDSSVIDKLIHAYAKSTEGLGGFYKKLTATVEKQYKGLEDVNDANKFYSMMFNKWKQNVVEMTRERFIQLRNQSGYGNDFIKMREFLKTVPDVNTREEVNAILQGNHDEDLSDAFEKYRWNSFGAGSGWVHVCSRYVTAKKDEYLKIDHRLYLNTESIDTNKMAALIVEKMDKHHLPYYFKFDQYGDRDDTIVIYSDSENLTRYIELLNEIKQENPELVADFKNPPVLTGKINSWIGYGSEPSMTPDGKRHSFNGTRADVIETSIRKVTNQWVMNHRNIQINYQGQQMSFQDYIAMKSTEKLFDRMKMYFDYKFEGETDIDFAKRTGYTQADIQSDNFKQYIYNILRSRMDPCLSKVCTGSKKDMQKIEIPVRNGKELLFTGYDLENTITELTESISKYDKDFVDNVKAEIINSSKQYGIDTDKYCFDTSTKEKMKILDARRMQNPFSSPPQVFQVPESNISNTEPKVPVNQQLEENIAATSDKDTVENGSLNSKLVDYRTKLNQVTQDIIKTKQLMDSAKNNGNMDLYNLLNEAYKNDLDLIANLSGVIDYYTDKMGSNDVLIKMSKEDNEDIVTPISQEQSQLKVDPAENQALNTSEFDLKDPYEVAASNKPRR